MDIDEREFEPIIDPDQFPEAFGGATHSFFPTECHCLGDGTCQCFEPLWLQDGSHDLNTNQAILERDLEENSNLFASMDNLAGIEVFQGEETSSKEPPLTSATMNCDTASQSISNGSEEKDPANTYESDWTKTQEGDPAISWGSDSTTTEEDSSTANGNDIPGVGRFQIEETCSDGLQCGMYALQISTNKQLAGDTLTPEAFRDIFRNEQEMRELNRRRGWYNIKEYHDEQLACVLRNWGNLNGYGKLQLGVFAEGRVPYILGANSRFVFVDSKAAMEDDLKSGFKTIWIHNDNVMELESAKINHFSGVTLLDTSEEQNKARRQEAAERKKAIDSQERAERQAAVERRVEAMRRTPKNRRERKDPHW